MEGHQLGQSLARSVGVRQPGRSRCRSWPSEMGRPAGSPQPSTQASVELCAPPGLLGPCETAPLRRAPAREMRGEGPNSTPVRTATAPAICLRTRAAPDCQWPAVSTTMGKQRMPCAGMTPCDGHNKRLPPRLPPCTRGLGFLVAAAP